MRIKPYKYKIFFITGQLKFCIKISEINILTPNMALKSGSLNLNGIFETCNRLG